MEIVAIVASAAAVLALVAVVAIAIWRQGRRTKYQIVQRHDYYVVERKHMF